MIDKETLVSIAKLHNLKPWQQEKHYIQTLILVAISESPLVFKGGTYLWFFHGLNRFSEDLDFTASETIPKDIEKKVSQTLETFGVENKIKIMTDDERGFSFRISSKGPINTTDVDVCHVYIEISKRENIISQPLSFKLNFEEYKLPTKIIRGMNLDEVVAEKIRAIMNRKKARDVYDLFFLIDNKKVEFNLDKINEKAKYYNTTFSESEFIAKINEKKEGWNKELEPWVFGELMDFDLAVNTIIKWIKTNKKK